MEDPDTRAAPQYFSLAYMATRCRNTVAAVRRAVDRLGLAPAMYEDSIPYYSLEQFDAIGGLLQADLQQTIREVCPEMKPPELLRFTSEQPVEFTFTPEADDD